MDSGAERKQKQIFGIRLAGRPKCVTARTGKQRFGCLLDTGAETSVLHERMFRGLKGVTLRKKDVDLQTANGSALKVLGVADIDFKLGDKDFRHSFVVVSNLNRNIILGNDWIEINGAILYFIIMKLRVGDTYVPFEEDIHISSLVRLKRDFVRPPTTACVCVRSK